MKRLSAPGALAFVAVLGTLLLAVVAAAMISANARAVSAPSLQMELMR
jgi:hypothetical protein